jgi:hypothetical protein
VTTLAHRLAVVTVAVLAAACSLTGTGDPGTAATVGDRSIPAAEIDESLASIRDSAAFQQQAQGDASGQFVLDAQNQIVTSFIRSEILDIVAERQDITVSDEEVAQARDELVDQLGGPEAFEDRIAEQGLSEEFVLQQLRDQQTQALLQDSIGASEDLAAFVRDEVADVAIEVNPRYGQWNEASLSVAPYDPLPGAGGAEAAASEGP